jgi:predicted outer membrane repeat protein
LTNCMFSGNSASNDGGAYWTPHDYPTFTNCTFSENEAGGDGGAFCIWGNGGTADFNNCILWGNTANNEGPQIAIKTDKATVTVNYCDVQGGKWDIYDPYIRLVWGDANNIEVDPLFVDADGADDTAGTEDDDLHLLWDSPCINVGDPSFAFDVNDRDIDDEPRVMVGRIDMGADEVGEKQADFTRNGRIDTEDLGVFVQSWLTTPIDIDWYILCDLIEDDQIDLKDYADFAADYLWQASWYEP